MPAQKGTKRLGRTGGSGVEEARSSPIPLGALKALSDSSRNAGHEDTPFGRAIGARMRNLWGHDAMTEKSLKAIKDSRTTRKAKGGSVSSASKRADGCATKGKTKGRFV